ncbi:MAG: outer membrane lipoprotein-sorting protein [Pseudomonadota bacterium]
MLNKLKSALLIALLATAVHAEEKGATVTGDRVDADRILFEAEAFRGAGMPGISMKVRIESFNGDEIDAQEMDVNASSGNSLIEFTAPAKLKGRKILMQGRNMWFISPDLRKPVPISPRQRLMGDASNGDIASTDYASDYGATFIRSDVYKGEKCHVLELKSKTSDATYDKIEYWISSASSKGVKADFFAVSGKLFKSADFEYENKIEFKQSKRPFISKMIITDGINADKKTVIHYAQGESKEISPSTFDLNSLLR